MKTINVLSTPSENKLAEITANYNEMAEALGKDPIKKFRDKPTAIKRHGQILDLYLVHVADQEFEETTKEKASKPTKAKPTSKPKYDLSGLLLLGETSYSPKEGSINSFIMYRLGYDLPVPLTGDKMIDIIVDLFRRPRDGSKVNTTFARLSIIWLIKEGHIELGG